MITVRSPYGVTVVYKRANVAVVDDGCHHLYTKYGDNGTLIAVVPKDWVVELDPADDVFYQGKQP